jgi:hypothetical protein
MNRRIPLAAVMPLCLILACEMGMPGGGTDNADDTDNTNTTDTSNDNTVSLSGTINSATTTPKTKHAAQTVNEKEGFGVLAQSAETGDIYRGVTDENGDFQIDIPDDEVGELFMVAIVKPDGDPAGPVVFDMTDDAGMTGLDLTQDAQLGMIMIPADKGDGPIMPGDGADLGDMVADDVMARLNDNGVPVGVLSVGKGDDAMGTPSDNPRQLCDADQDGLLDVIDADNDGDGVVDEFDPDTDRVGGIPLTAGLNVNFFMNLKVGNDNANTYYAGTATDIVAALERDTVITFEVVPTQDATRTITAVRALARPGPDYMTVAEKMTDTGMGNEVRLWSESEYAFDEAGDRFQAFVHPNEEMNAGDTFTIAVTFDDETTRFYSRMINFVFKSIPRLRNFGQADSLTAFGGTQPIPFDGAQDLTLEFNPPRDETDAFLTGLDYHFEIFYLDGDGNQIGDIDAEATYPTPITGFEAMGHRTAFVASGDAQTLSDDDTLTVTLPSEIFVDTVQTGSGAEAVSGYKIDIAAQSTGGNAAIMLHFEKQ